jgi:cysteinyl-tRNA synthetase
MIIYNSETKQKEALKPLNEKKLSLYVCGITVYDYCHIGHARLVLTFDMISRYLRYRGFNLHYVRNITDIDDKIIKRAIEKNESYTAVANQFIQAMKEDFHALNVLDPDEQPRATDHIPQMLSMIQTLIDKKLAYVASSGDVLYTVEGFEGYGRLSKRTLAAMQAGHRVSVDHAKRNPFDFVLWKMAKPGEPSWESPWGNGRPGWHIECSVMSKSCLGEQIDLHGGGADLLFPHHENEIAQSEGASGKQFVNCWMHVGFLQINNEKMSKSLDNFFLIRDVLKNYRAEVLRYFMLSSLYRSPLNFHEASLDNAQQALHRFYTALRGTVVEKNHEKNTVFEEKFQQAMDDDFNTPEAFAVLFDLAKEINCLKTVDQKKANRLASLLVYLGGVLGLLQDDPDHFLREGEVGLDEKEIMALIEQREQARRDKNWAQADCVRGQLSDHGIVLEDGPEGTTWRVES